MKLRDHLDLLRRIGGALPDATWVRRQLGPDADLLRDLKHGVRALIRERGFAISATGVLAQGLGAATALFTLTQGLLLRPLPYLAPERIVTLWQIRPETAERGMVAPGNFYDLRQRSRSLVHLAAAIPVSHDYQAAERPEVLFGVSVTEGFFDAFGMLPLHGRLFRTADHARGSNQICVLGERLWRETFSADPSIVGRMIQLDGAPFEVVGVLPASFEGVALSSAPGRRDLFTPHVVAEFETRIRGSAWWGTVARLAPTATIESAQAELQTIFQGLALEYPKTNKGVRGSIEPLSDHLTAAVRPALKLMLAAVSLLVGIVWANVAGLLLARGMRRERELAIRASLGAGRLRLLRQLLSETLLVALVGGTFAWGIAHATLRGIVALSPVDVPRLDQVAIDSSSLFFLAALTGLTALACGLTPALRLSRPRLQSALHLRLRAGSSSGSSRLRSGLVVAEVAVALLLLVGTGLVIRSLDRLLKEDPGFRSNGIATLQVFAGDSGSTPESLRGFFAETLDGMRALPGVTSAGAVSRMPFMEANLNIMGAIKVEGEAEAEGAQEPQVSVAVATHGYFETMQIPLIEGRLFDRTDQAGSSPAIVVNETLARHFLKRGALGRVIAIRFRGRMQSGQVIGVVASVRQERLDGPPEPEAFFLHAQLPFSSMSYVLRSEQPAGRLIEPAKRVVWAKNPMQTLYRTATLDELVHKTLSGRRFLAIVLSAFAGLALLLTASGLYGLISVLAAERTREFGVRLALGARGADVYRLVVGQGLRLVLPGVALGLVAAALGVQALRGALFGVTPLDPATFAGMTLSLLVVSVLACLGPARRAVRVDPTVALRVE